MAQWLTVPIVRLETGVRAPKSSKAFCCVLDAFLREYFLSAETSALKATTFYAQMETLIKYIPIPTHTCRYMHIHEHTYNIHADTDTLHVCVYICVYK